MLFVATFALILRRLCVPILIVTVVAVLRLLLFLLRTAALAKSELAHEAYEHANNECETGEEHGSGNSKHHTWQP